MTVLAALLLGILIGWLIEWVIDWVYWRPKRVTTETTSSISHAEAIPVTAELDDLRTENANLKSEMEGHTVELDNLRAENTRQKSQLEGIPVTASPAITAELDNLRTENARLKSQLEGNTATVNPAATAEFDDLRAENESLKSEQEGYTAGYTGTPDNLQKINGVGPEIEHRLNGAGIMSFAQLAKLTPTQLENILGDQIKNMTDEQDLLNQARRLADQSG